MRGSEIGQLVRFEVGSEKLSRRESGTRYLHTLVPPPVVNLQIPYSLAHSHTMSEWVPKDQPRPIRILALHGYPNQSAASYRALLSPLIKALPQWYEFHFLEADFPCVGVEDPQQQRDPSSATLAALLLCSRLLALSGEKQAQEVRAEMQGRGRGNEADTGDEVQRQITQVQNSLQESSSSNADARQVWKEFTSHGGRTGEGSSNGLDSAESLLVKSNDLPPDRNWYLPHPSPSQSHSSPYIGIQTSLAKIGAYIREHGPFHGGIGSGSGYQMLRLVTYLFRTSNHPQCAFAFPLLFPLLPIDSPAPRMGGWEVLPSVGLPSGRRHAVSQVPLLFVIRTGQQQQDNAASSRGVEEEVDRWKQGRASGDGEQSTKEYAVVHEPGSSQLLFK